MRIDFKEGWDKILVDMPEISEEIKFSLKRAYRFGQTESSLDYMELTRKELDAIYKKAKEITDRSVMMQVSAYTNAIDAPDKAKVANIKVFAPILQTYFSENAINHWVFISKEGHILPYLVKDIKFKDAERDDPASVTLSLIANSVDYYGWKSFSFGSGDVVGKTVEEILAKCGVMHETQELIDEYMITEEKFLKERSQFNKQYRVKGRVKRVRSRWDVEEREVSFNSRAVNDEEVNSRKYVFKTTVPFWKESEPEGGDKVYPIPVHPFIYLYSLETYENIYVHINSIEDYVYDDSLKEKLILPQTHSDLLDILTQDLELLSGDIIEGKSTGTTILCKGKPGTGKTLTAEAYSEITHRPLYKVNSGQLGTHPQDVEKNLEEILNRAQRWGAVMLIDEADTYIRQRGDDIQQNAIVAAFLRTLEYFNGLLFMTTNRMDDVDDAIASRCIATIDYSIPDGDRAARIWKVQADNFKIDLSEDLIKELVETFPSVSGRDIKELLRLTARFAQAKGLELSKKVFISCAQFRGIEIKEG